MAAADIKHKHEEVKVKFDVGPFQTKNAKIGCKHRKAAYKYNTTKAPSDVPLEQRTSDPG